MRNGDLWPDDNGVHINAHGGGILAHGGRYYLLMSGCTGWAPNAARGAVAEHPFGPWREIGNPCRGVNPANGLGPELTYGSQSTFVLRLSDDRYLAMFDLWQPTNFIDSRYLWLPVVFTSEGYEIHWAPEVGKGR